MLQSLSWRINLFPKVLEDPNFSLSRKHKFIGKVYSKCEKLILSMKKLFALSFMILHFDCFTMALSTAFFGYDILAHELNTNDVLLFVGGISYATIAGTTIFLIIFYLSKFKDHKNSLMLSLNNLRRKNLKLNKIIQLSIYQLDCVPTELSCGLFVFEIPHIFIMISSFFSYLIVTIQFDFMSSDFINEIAGKE
jgi:hypothetical protein